MALILRLDKVNIQEAKNKVADFLISSRPHKIFTPNPEMYVLAHQDKKFLQVLNGGDLNICDGTGLSWFYHTPRITGTDFMLEILRLANQAGQTAFLLGAGETAGDAGLSACAENLQKIIPGLKITGSDVGEKIMVQGEEIVYDQEKNQTLINKINNSGATVLLVGFGMNKQEKWIEENLSKLVNIKIAMGVGGALDFYSGRVLRAPCFFRKIGLEWLYRLIQEPRRIRRILTAVFKFPCLALKDKISG